MPGPPPKPTVLKVLTGNPGHRTINQSEPQPDQGEPRMPKGLSALAKREWRSIVPELRKLGVLTVVDGKALAAYCSAYALWVQAEAEITKYGLTIATKTITRTGETVICALKRNPAVGIKVDALRLMKAYLTEFGLSPASRSRIHAEKPAERDEFSEYLNAKRSHA